MLVDPGDFRYQSIDSKPPIALQNMVENAGEVVSEVKIRQRSQELGKKGNFLMVRESLTMILDHFRTTSHDETLFKMRDISTEPHCGDKEMHSFLNAS